MVHKYTVISKTEVTREIKQVVCEIVSVLSKTWSNTSHTIIDRYIIPIVCTNCARSSSNISRTPSSTSLKLSCCIRTPAPLGAFNSKETSYWSVPSKTIYFSYDTSSVDRVIVINVIVVIYKYCVSSCRSIFSHNLVVWIKNYSSSAVIVLITAA